MDPLTSGEILEIKMEPESLDTSIPGFTAEMTAPEKRKGTKAEFHVYIHESVKKVKAAFYISRHGMGDLTKPELQKFAKEEQVALIGMYGDPVQRGVDSVAELDKYIQKLAKISGHPELPNVPIMSFGHSNGTGFAASWPRDRPEQVIAWIGFHPGFNDYLQYPNTENVPAMIMAGSIDKYLIKHRQDKTVANMRKTRNAAMNMMLEGDVGHGPADHGATWVFITEYLKAAMRVRLNDDGSLKPVNIKEGWLGERYDLEKGGRQKLTVAPYDKFKGDKSIANWLPDEEFAKQWQHYGKTK
jgi:dienelactone hydrolase